jgi:antitoxin component YwqK of YwqJK toxin-antitoxin module
MIKRILFLLILNVFLGFTGFSQEKIKIRINDSTFFEHDVIVTKNDTINGKKIAVYANDTTVIAYQKSYYEGYQTGFHKIYFPNGKLMETSVYMKDKKNGDYTLYEIDGSIIVKGRYTQDIKDGFWAYRKHKIFGKYKDGLKHGKWKWYQPDGSFYVYKFDKGKLLSVSVKNAPEFPEYLLNP